MDDSPITWRSLLALGISGGILPCPSALVVMLGAISLNRVGFGLILIIAFSIGLAGVLTGIGLLFLKGKQMLSRFRMTSPLLRFLPVGSAFVILILGVVLTTNSLRQFAH
jgi:ABC-type nickel/cobalt efflux system permease component RcnA